MQRLVPVNQNGLMSNLVFNREPLWKSTLCDCIKYVDDSTVYEDCDKDGHDSKIQVAADQAMEWTQENLMEVNTDKTKEIVVYFGRKELEVPQIIMQDSQIERVSGLKLLGIIFQ